MIFDLHCDTALKLYTARSYDIDHNKFQVDLEKLSSSKALGQFFAFFINKYSVPMGSTPFLYYRDIMRHFKRCVEKNKEKICIVTNGQEIEKNYRQGKLSAILTIEGGEAVEKDLNNVKRVFEDGVRLMTLTWNYPNAIGYPNMSKSYSHKGLTPYGFDVIKEMEQLGMLVDVSHLSDQGFYDVATTMKGPFVASHSNARSICHHPRNLKDDMIKIIAEKGGVIGINYYAPFVAGERMSKVKNIVKHIKHIYNIGGIDVLGLGSDFDGIDENVEMQDASMVNMLMTALQKEGFTSNQLDKIGYENTMRVIRDVLK